jgi:hypothetical protein
VGFSRRNPNRFIELREFPTDRPPNDANFEAGPRPIAAGDLNGSIPTASGHSCLIGEPALSANWRHSTDDGENPESSH